jgi:Tol biopolymer transport system component
VKFSPDGKKLLYYRMAVTAKMDNNTYGTYDLVIANADGSDAVVYGDSFRWASWGPDGSRIACLDKTGIQIVDLASRKVLRQIPRSGIVQQLVWSPDGKRFVGTANGLGVAWTIGCLDAEAAIRGQRDRPVQLHAGLALIPSISSIHAASFRTASWAQLMAKADGSDRQMLYAEQGRHTYGGAVSPDGQYVLFTLSEVDLGQWTTPDSWPSFAAGIRRWLAAPMSRYAGISEGPYRPDVGPLWGWEPTWTVKTDY